MMGMVRDDDIWIVVPAYNEAARLAATLRPLIAAYAHIVLVDDGSQDNTAEVARRDHVWVARHLVNCGQGAALQTGIDFALGHGAQVIVTFDADGQHSVDDIAALVAPLLAGRVDIALGSRFLGSAPSYPARAG